MLYFKDEQYSLYFSDSTEICSVTEAPVGTIQVLATCHSLVQLEDELVGDPLEKATLSAINWNLTKGMKFLYVF